MVYYTLAHNQLVELHETLVVDAVQPIRSTTIAYGLPVTSNLYRNDTNVLRFKRCIVCIENAVAAFRTTDERNGREGGMEGLGHRI